MRRVLLLAVVASCYRNAPSPQMEARIDKLERRVAEQDREIAAMRSGRNRSATLGPLSPGSPTAEAMDSKPIQCEFESHPGHSDVEVSHARR